jgi:tetratricopeptide (TPR) repeat protein
MPMTEFARMQRSDHSMLPPTPSATIAYGSPNACNICHKDRDAVWADRWVRRWRERDYQAPVLARASLVEAARKEDWSRLPDILAYIEREDHEEVFAASLIRLLRACGDDRKWPVLLRSMEDPSPLVRASAADSVRERPDEDTLTALIRATQDESRLVRIRAASALAGYPRDRLRPDQVAGFDRAVEDLIASRAARPDHWDSHYNTGNFYMARGEIDKAISSFETAIRQQPDAVMPYVNLSLAYNSRGRNADAERSLRKALSLEPEDGAINLNLGLLLGELGRSQEAIPYFRKAAERDPQSAAAAYNLGVSVAGEGRLGEAIEWCRRAYRLRPEDPKYGYTLAFYLNRNGNTAGAISILEEIVSKKIPYPDAYAFLGELYEGGGEKNQAIRVYRQALQIEGLPLQLRNRLRARIQTLTR